MSGFQAPNYTQVPNDFFELARDMDKAELKVLLALIRETFGYHRDSCEMSIRQLARAAGLTPRNAYAGAEKAIQRGLIEKIVSSTNTTTWRAVVERDTARVRRGYSAVSPHKSKSPVKEIKETIKENHDDDALRQISRAYESVIGIINPMIADELREASTTYPLKWVLDAIRESANNNKHSWSYVRAILTRWKAQGNQEAMNKPSQNKKQVINEPAAFEAIRQFERMQNGNKTGN